MATARNSRVVRTIPLLLTICLFTFPTHAQYSGGRGTSDDPYQIATAEGLMLLGEIPGDYDKHFILTADIDLDPNLPGRKVFDRAVIAPDADDAEPRFQGTPFTGVFDGNGHTISNLTVIGESYLGLFGELASPVEVNDVGLLEVNIYSLGDFVGGLAGYNEGDWWRLSIDQTGHRAGVRDSYCTGKVSGVSEVGGLIGFNDGVIMQCYSACQISANGAAGGLAGNNWGYVIGCHSTGEVAATGSGVGGLVGHNGSVVRRGFGSGSVIYCYSTGSVSGSHNVGGLVGYNPTGHVVYCYSAGSVSQCHNAGGLVGNNVFCDNECEGRYCLPDCTRGTANLSFWDTTMSNQTRSAGGTGKTTAEMQTASVFLEAGWDFVDETANGAEGIWWILEGQDYPRLWWERLADDVMVLVVDDFESYNDIGPPDPATHRVFDFWISDFRPDLNLIWLDRVAHSGVHSMGFSYYTAFGTTQVIAKKTKTLVSPRDWTQGGATELSLWFHGNAGNSAERMFVALNGVAVYHEDPAATQLEGWNEWVINLEAFGNQGVDLANVNKITIGFGAENAPAAGGTGTMYFDDIRLCRPAEPEP